MRPKVWTIGTMIMAGVLLFPLGSIAIDIRVPNQAKQGVERSPIIQVNGDNVVLTPPGLEKLMFIHYKKGFGKPPWAGGGTKEKESKCYEFLGRGIKWHEADLPIDYVMSLDLSGDPIRRAVEEWDYWTGSKLFGGSDFVNDASWDDDFPDGRNELVFGDYPEHGVIAVTVVWGYFSGPPGKRKITEFDILFDTDFTWGDATENPEVMDLQNIATHEIGHGLGLADLYEEACADESMYGYSTEGETKKSDLNTGDIAGIQELYGSN